MSLTANIEIPDIPLNKNPAFILVAGVSILTRLILGAAQAGISDFRVVGKLADVAEERFGKDKRFKALNISWGEKAERDAAPIQVEANVVVGNPVWEMLSQASSACYAPGARKMVRIGVGTSQALWSNQPPPGAYVVTVDNENNRARAKQVIFQNVTKATSGPVSRKINARFSLPVSKLLSEFGVTPNQITIVTTIVGIISAWYMAKGTIASLAVGGALFQLCAILDRVDGELARSTFKASKHGAWIDTVGDNLVYLVFLVCLTLGYHKYTLDRNLWVADWVIPVGVGMVCVTVLLVGSMALYLIRHKQPGTMTAVQLHIAQSMQNNDSGWVYSALDKIKVLGKRDSFSLAVFFLAIYPFFFNHPGGYHILFWAAVCAVLLIVAYYLSAILSAQMQGSD